MYFDTHAHYDDKAFDEDREELLQSLASADVELIIDPGCDVDSSRKALELAERFPFVYAAVGLHPEELDKYSPESFEEICSMARHPRCVAIGEIGLDYYYSIAYGQ